jgi:hypothetical protein
VALVNQRPAEKHARAGAGEAAHGDIEARLRAALRDAMTTRDVVAAFALRSALSAIGNAGAVPAPASAALTVPMVPAAPVTPAAPTAPIASAASMAPATPVAPAASMAPAAPATSAAPAASAYVAGSAPGLGAREAPRRPLTQAEVAGIVRAEAAERDSTAGRCEQAGHPDRAETLRREAAILRAALGESPPQSGSGR